MELRGIVRAALLIAAVVVAGCSKKPTPESVPEIQTSDNAPIGKSNAISLLRAKYQSAAIRYYNDLNYLGIGVVNPKKFDFLFITDTATGNGLNIDNIEEQEYLIPIFHKPDYQIFYMPVIDSFGKHYEVKVNTETSVFVYKRDFEFYTWKELFTKKAIVVRAKKGYVKQDVESKSVLFDDSKESVWVKEFDGDWLRVVVTPDDEEFLTDGNGKSIVNETRDDGAKRPSYWVKWRDKNKLLIEPIFLC